jgi:hypothetical protein
MGAIKQANKQTTVCHSVGTTSFVIQVDGTAWICNSTSFTLLSYCLINNSEE